MGYYTRFNLEVSTKSGGEVDEATLQKVQARFDDMLGWSGAFDEVTDYSDEWKWYEYEHDMIEFSKEFPNLCFTLEGDGEDREDWWTEWFQNGKFYKSVAKITPPDIAPPDGFWE